MHNSTSRHDTRRQGRRARIIGLLGATAITTFALVTATAAPAGAVAAPSLTLHDARTGSVPVCPDDGLAAWHFALAPADGTRQFASIALDLDGTTHTFTDSMIVPNGGRPDDVFVAVPPGLALSSLVIERSTATVTPGAADTAGITFALLDACDGVVPDTAVSSASSAGSTDVAEPVESATVAVGLAPGAVLVRVRGTQRPIRPARRAPAVEAICAEIGTTGETVRAWFRVTNDEDRPVTYEWVDGSITVEPGASADVGTGHGSLTSPSTASRSRSPMPPRSSAPRRSRSPRRSSGRRRTTPPTPSSSRAGSTA